MTHTNNTAKQNVLWHNIANSFRHKTIDKMMGMAARLGAVYDAERREWLGKDAPTLDCLIEKYVPRGLRVVKDDAMYTWEGARV